MEPLNKKERSKAIRKFTLIYLLTIFLIFLISYFFFRVPYQSFLDENQKLKTSIAEQRKLLVVLDTLGDLSQEIEGYDVKLNGLSDPNGVQYGQLSEQTSEKQDQIKSFFLQVQRDSSNFTDRINKRSASALVRSFRAALAYRNTIKSLRQSLSTYTQNSGDYARKLQEMSQENQSLLQQLSNSKMLLAATQNNGGGGGGGGDPEKVKALQAKLGRYQSELSKSDNARIQYFQQTILDIAPGAPLDCKSQIEYYHSTLKKMYDLQGRIGSPEMVGKYQAKIDEINTRVGQKVKGCP